MAGYSLTPVHASSTQKTYLRRSGTLRSRHTTLRFACVDSTIGTPLPVRIRVKTRPPGRLRSRLCVGHRVKSSNCPTYSHRAESASDRVAASPHRLVMAGANLRSPTASSPYRPARQSLCENIPSPYDRSGAATVRERFQCSQIDIRTAPPVRAGGQFAVFTHPREGRSTTRGSNASKKVTPPTLINDIQILYSPPAKSRTKRFSRLFICLRFPYHWVSLQSPPS